MLKEAGVEKQAEITVWRGTIVLRKPRRNPRQGWAEASRRVAEQGDDKLVWPQFGNRDDKPAPGWHHAAITVASRLNRATLTTKHALRPNDEQM